MFSMAFLLISIQCAASVDDNSAFSAKNVVEYHKCVKASMLKCFNGVSTFPTTGKLATESPRIMIVTPIPSNPTESTATETSSNDAAPPNFDNQPKTLTGENLSNAIGQAANEIVNLFIRADCDKWNANYDKCMKYKGKAVRLDSLVDLFKKLKDAVCKNEEDMAAQNQTMAGKPYRQHVIYQNNNITMNFNSG